MNCCSPPQALHRERKQAMTAMVAIEQTAVAVTILLDRLVTEIGAPLAADLARVAPAA